MGLVDAGTSSGFLKQGLLQVKAMLATGIYNNASLSRVTKMDEF
jgi:hypothetical protein